MLARTIIFRMFALLLVVCGGFVWMSRMDYSPEPILQQRLGDRLIAVNSNLTTDLSDECNVFTDDAPWIVFVLSTKLIADASFRTYFETSEDELQSLWAEYDPPLLRIGLGLGVDGNSTTDIPVRIVRRTEEVMIVIAVQEAGTRVIANATEKQSSWPGVGGGGWRCNAVRIGTGTRELASGNGCSGCENLLQYATGTDQEELNELLTDLNNEEHFNRLRWTGTLLTLLGALGLVVSRRTIRGLFGRDTNGT